MKSENGDENSLMTRKRGRPSLSVVERSDVSDSGGKEDSSPASKRFKFRSNGGSTPGGSTVSSSPASSIADSMVKTKLSGRKSASSSTLLCSSVAGARNKEAVASSIKSDGYQKCSGVGNTTSASGTDGKFRSPGRAARHSFPTTCPVAGCDSRGHMNGKDSAHLTISGCPNYYGLTWRQCAEMRAREEGLALPPSMDTSSLPSTSTDIKDGNGRAGQLTVKEPSLEGLASAMEIYQFRRAQQALVSDKEREVRRHFELASSDKVQRINEIVFGRYKLTTWYRSNYPDDVACMPTIYVCPHCLAYMKYSAAYQRHSASCKWNHPPGDEIYRFKKYSFFEVDGAKFREYCQKLCLLAKLFLKHKTVHEVDQVAPFYFYVLAKASEEGFQLIGYFSKQKLDDQKLTGINPSMYYNLSCILTLPQYMRQGFGKMLIDFSYELSRIEGRIGSPERPLSDMGLMTYRNYWREIIVKYLDEYQDREISIRAMSQSTNIYISDIVATLLSMGMIKYFRTEYYILKKREILDKYLAQYAKRTPDPEKQIHPECLHWTPSYVTTGVDV